MIIIDLNTLISTIVTATAALVAIIGGFLISRVITLSSEQTGIKRRMREIKNDIFAKREMLKKVEQNLLDEDAEEFIEDKFSDILYDNKSLGDILSTEDFRGRSSEELRPYIEELYIVGRDLHKKMVDVQGPFDEFIKSHEIELPQRKNWYELIYDWVITQRKKREREMQSSLFGGGMGINIIPPFSGLTSSITSQASIQAYRQKQRDREKLKDDLTVLKLQKGEQNKILKDYGKPKGLWWGLAVLFYACLVGIVFPSTLLPYSKGVYDDELTKWVILWLFFSQLLFLFLYLCVYMYILTKTDRDIEH